MLLESCTQDMQTSLTEPQEDGTRSTTVVRFEVAKSGTLRLPRGVAGNSVGINNLQC